jgi:hypothetical protein
MPVTRLEKKKAAMPARLTDTISPRDNRVYCVLAYAATAVVTPISSAVNGVRDISGRVIAVSLVKPRSGEVDPGFGTRGVVGAGAVPSC